MALAQYSELFWFPSGELAASVPARVFQHETNTLATLWADSGGTTPLANPLSTSGTGRLEFWIEEGLYWVHIDSEAFEIAVGAASQPATQQDIDDEVTRADATYAALAGATFTGGVTMDGANLTIQRADDTGAYRFRVTGGGLDLEIAGLDAFISAWQNPDFSGTQSNVMRWEPAGPHLIGRTQFGTGPFDTVHDIDAGAGVAGLGAKNSLTNVRFCGFKNSVGAPAIGTWVAGDVILDSTGTWHLCTASGTPGTWTTGPVDQNLPSEQNLLDWTYDPDMAGHVTAQSSGGVAGRITLVRHILRKQITWSNIWIGLAGVDAAASLANCYLGVYDSGGTLRGTTADISSSLMSGAVAKPLALASPFVAAPGTYFIALLLNGTWTTNALTLKASGAGVSVNAGLSAPNLRYSNLLTGQTSLPASLTLANQVTSIINTGWASQWYGIS